MKKTYKKIIILLIMSIIYISLYKNRDVVPTSSHLYLGYFSQVPPNYEELLQIEYGESPYSVSYDNIKISIEKTVSEKYYIVYSWVSGDQSYFGVNAIIEDTEHGKLDKEDFEYMYIKDDKGNTHIPLPYYSIIDFPVDMPLGWRQILFVRFSPLGEDVKSIDIYITYRGEEKVIEGVPIR